MFLELAEALDCPRCRSGFGLVAFVDESAGRRVVEGTLGCPLCELEYPIRGGTIDFGPDVGSPGHPATGAGETARHEPVGKAASRSPDPPPDAPAREPEPDVALRLAALLGLSDRSGMALLLGPGLSAHAVELARMAERSEVLTWLEPEAGPRRLSPEDLSAGVDPLRGAARRHWPVRAGHLHGIALMGPMDCMLDEAERCARQGARLVALDPTPRDRERLASSSFQQLAEDERTWVGERR